MYTTKKSHITRVQQGGALVESILICGVLVIFMTGIPMMGSLIDVKQQAIQASRYAAWEKTIQDPGNERPHQVDARFFRHDSAPIATSRPGDDLLGQNHLWGPIEHAEQQNNAPGQGDGTGTGEQATGEGDELQLYQRARVTADVNNILVAPKDANPGDIYTGIGTATSFVGTFLSPEGWEEPNIESDGLVRMEVEVSIENNEFLTGVGVECSNGGACIKESTAILTDGWSAATPNDIRDRVHGFVPTSKLERVGEVISRVHVVPLLGDLETLGTSFGCVKLGVRPTKELTGLLPNYQDTLVEDRNIPGDAC